MSPLRAQIDADRHGFSDGTETVDPGRLQAPLGYSYTGATFYSHEFGQLFLRYGITAAFEVRAGINSFVVNESSREEGYSGSSLQVKVRLFRAEKAALSGVATLGLATEAGGLAARDDRARQELTRAADLYESPDLTATVNAGTRFYYASGTQGDRDVRALIIPTITYAGSKRVDLYAGYAGYYDDGPNAQWFEGGVTYLYRKSTQFDINSGVGIDDNSDAFFVGAGVAQRF